MNAYYIDIGRGGAQIKAGTWNTQMQDGYIVCERPISDQSRYNVYFFTMYPHTNYYNFKTIQRITMTYK